MKLKYHNYSNLTGCIIKLYINYALTVTPAQQGNPSKPMSHDHRLLRRYYNFGAVN